MEILVVFAIFGAAIAALAGYMKKALKQGDGCSSCSGDKGSCGAKSKGNCH
ncbi:MAG: hypothetical protein HQL19_00630 [Candidatus Omnitrophica bacterium]|nr:hypothetical protein [Candidatus Omnitrophota bacterium]